MALRFFIQLGLISLSFGPAAAYLAPLHGMDIRTKEKDVYIVVFHDDHTLEKHWQATSLDLTHEHRFRHHDQFNMYTTTADTATLDTIRADPGVKYVEVSYISQQREIRDFAWNRRTTTKRRTRTKQKTTEKVVSKRTNDEPQRSQARSPLPKRANSWNVEKEMKPPWNLRVVAAAEQISDRNHIGEEISVQNWEGVYEYVQDAGKGVWIYIFDSGVRIGKGAFGGRAKNFNGQTISPYLPPGDAAQESMDDLAGHGTYVAGIAGAKYWGVAPHSTLINVKMLNSTGHASYEGTIAAFNDVVAQHKSNIHQSSSNDGVDFRGSVINTAWRWPLDTIQFAFASALETAYVAGIYVAAAAGNQNVEAKWLPCISPYVSCVGAINADYWRWPYSNYGPKVTYQAPGEDVYSIDIHKEEGVDGNPRSDNISLSGTSAAAPHLAGAVAIFMSWRGSDRSGANHRVVLNALRDKIFGLRNRSRNILVNTGINNPEKDDNEPFRDAGPNPRKGDVDKPAQGQPPPPPPKDPKDQPPPVPPKDQPPTGGTEPTGECADNDES